MDRQKRIEAEIKKAVDGRTKEFKEKIAKLAYEKIKAALVPSKEPLKGFPYNEAVDLQEKDFVIKVAKAGPRGKDLIQKVSGKDQKDAVAKFRKEHPRLKNDMLDVKQLANMKMKGGKYVFTYDDVNEETLINLDESVLVEKLRVKKPNQVDTIDIDYIGNSGDRSQSERKHKIKIKMTGRQTADITGKKGDIIKFLQGDAYAMDDEDIEELFPELLESVLVELNARYGLPDMKQSKDPKVKRELAKLMKVQYGSLQYIRQYKEVEAALDASLPAHKRKK